VFVTVGVCVGVGVRVAGTVCVAVGVAVYGLAVGTGMGRPNQSPATRGKKTERIRSCPAKGVFVCVGVTEGVGVAVGVSVTADVGVIVGGSMTVCVDEPALGLKLASPLYSAVIVNVPVELKEVVALALPSTSSIGSPMDKPFDRNWIVPVGKWGLGMFAVTVAVSVTVPSTTEGFGEVVTVVVVSICSVGVEPHDYPNRSCQPTRHRWGQRG